MNRRQQERVADLGRAFQSALEEIIDMGEGEEKACVEYEDTMPDLTPEPVNLTEGLASWDVNIRHVHNGFIVSVGCQTFVFETFDKMAKYMAIYYDDPQGTYEKHYKGELFKQYL